MRPLVARSALTLLSILVTASFPVAAAGEPEAQSCRQIRGAETPEDPSDDVSVCRQDVWFHQGEQQVGNLAALDQGNYPSWNSTRPTGSLEAGSGGVYVASSALHQLVEGWDPRGTPRFDGTFSGDIDSLAMSFYVYPPVTRAQGSDVFRTNLRVSVGSELVADAEDLQVPMHPAGIGVRRIDIALTNAYDTLKDLGLTGPDRTHEIRVQIVGTGLATSGAVFLYDAVETPSGMVFNVEPDRLGGFHVIDLAPPPPPE